MGDDKGRIPIIAVITSCVMILMGFMFASMLILMPEKLYPTIDLKNTAIHGLTYGLGIRSFTMALGLLLALILRSRLGLIAVLSMRFVTEGLDMTNFPPDQSSPGMYGFVGILMLLELVSIVLLWRATRAAKP